MTDSDKRVKIYFARAVDDQDRSTIGDLADVVRLQVWKRGAELVDPVLSELALLRSLQPAEEVPDAEIVEADLQLLRSCEAVLMDMSIPNRNYVGCCCEMVYANMWNIPVGVNVGTTGYENRIWLRHHAAVIGNTISDTIDYLLLHLASDGEVSCQT